MRHLSCLRIEAMVAAMALMLFFLNFFGPLNGTLSAKLVGPQASALTAEVDKLVVAYVTTPSKETGRDLAKSIISSRLAACVNQIPGIESTYWWDGKVVLDTEVLLMIKTRESLFDALIKYVKANHPYEVPEVIAIPIIGGNRDYIQWLKESTALTNV